MSDTPDPRHAIVDRLIRERGIEPGMRIPDELFFAAGYTQAEVDAIKVDARYGGRS